MQQRLIVVSNRGPVGFERDAAGNRSRRHAAGGLAAALRPLVPHHDVTWIASAMTDEERVIAAGGPVEERVAGASLRLRLVAHEPAAYRSFYDVVANRALWFVQHGLEELLGAPGPDLSRAWHDGYLPVNAAFAQAVLDELECGPEAAVLFQDYHLYVAPVLVRTARPQARLSHFVHIPWVGPEAWAALPLVIARAAHEGLLACDSVGFHAERWREAFVASAEALVGRGDEARALSHVNPVGVDAAGLREVASGHDTLARERSLVRGRPERLILRVDRTDPAKNAVVGFAAFDRLLRRRPDLHGRVGMLALLDPSRQNIAEYAAYRRAVEAEAAAVNAAHATGDWSPVDLRIRDDFPSSIAAYRQYDVLLVNSVMDGLNLVAEEAPLVNTRDGVLVLSRCTGAWEALGEWAIGVDPHDVEGTSAALERALELPGPERRSRLEGIRARVLAHSPADWADAELAALDARSTMRG
jgi:trehalose 6-phosphate synthase